jgi:hypothetical protein
MLISALSRALTEGSELLGFLAALPVAENVMLLRLFLSTTTLFFSLILGAFALALVGW